MSFYLRFDLFDKTTSNESKCKAFQDLKIGCTHFGRNNLWIGDLEGIVYKYDKDLSSSIFIAYETCVFHIYQCPSKDILITCGMDTSTNDVIKLWDLSKWNKQNIPTILREIHSTNPGELDFKVVCFNVLNNLNAMVLGLANGQVDLIYSDILVAKKTKRKQIYFLSEITTVAINQINDQLYIYVTTTNRIVILAFNEHTNEIKETLNVEEGSCPRNCSVLVDNVFVVANQKGIYDVHLDYVGPCRALDGDNVGLYLYKHYLILVKLVKPSVLTGTHLIKKPDQRPAALTYQIVIFDHVNRFIACEFPLPDFNFLYIEWGSIHIYCGHPTNKIFVFTEKDVQTKLKIFFQKNSFKLAIEIAKSQNVDEEALADMFRQYAEHLYREKHYDEAIQQYIKTIGRLEPSFVITKYLTTSHVPNLVKYLEVLVQRDDCTGQHNALLLNCYIIMKDQESLVHFIKNHKIMTFEIDKVLNLLRKERLYTEALELALRYGQHDWYLKILIEDLSQCNEAIDYISKLPLPETEEALLNYGNILIDVEPEILAQQLERVCDEQSDSKLNISTILNVFVNNRKGLIHFLKRYISKEKTDEEAHSVYIYTLLELLLYEVEKEKSTKSADEVMEILQNEKLVYNKSRAMICCQMRNFTKGFRYLCEVQAKYLEILYSFQAEHDIDGVMETCHKFGSFDPKLWIKALEYLIEIKADAKYFNDVISEIEVYGLISPLLLLEKMTLSPHSLQFGLVKDFILRYYEKNEKLIKEYQKEISTLKEETKKNHDIIQCLDTEVQVFQNLKCMICSNVLDIPSVHFLCNHSYHMRCFETYTYSKEECPNCAPKIVSVLSEINQWQSNKTTSLTDATSLSLEMLWENVLKNPNHPITMDPDQCISDTLIRSVLSSTSLNEKKTSETKVNKPIVKSETNKPTNKSATLHAVSSNIDIKKDSISKVSSVEKFSKQSPDKPVPFVKKGPPQAAANPFEKPVEPKRSIPISKNPFDSVTFKGFNLAGSNKSDISESKNPFGESSDSKDNYPEKLNPFE